MRRIATLGVAILVGLGSSTPVFGHPTPPRLAAAHPLVVGAIIERELPAGGSHAYTLRLQAGDFVHITIFQRGVDVATTVTEPDGHELLAIDACDDFFRPETITAIVEATGRYTVVVRPASSAPRAGRYAIQLDDVHRATASDSDRVEAEREFEVGRALATRRPRASSDALVSFNSALAKYRQSGDRHGEMKAMLEIARAEYVLRRAQEALESSRRAAEIAREVGDDATASIAIHGVGVATEWLGDLEGAHRLYGEAATLARRAGDPQSEARSLNSDGVFYGRTGDPENAIAAFERAQARARTAGDRQAGYFALNNLGITYKNVGKYDKALDVLRQALATRRAAGELDGQVVVLNNMGNVQHLLGHDRQALATHLEALALARNAGGKENIARSLNTIGQTYQALGDYTKALGYIRESLVIRRDIGDLLGLGASLSAEGKTLHRLADDREAVARFHEALDVQRAIRDQLGELESLRGLAEAERGLGDLADATADIRSAVDLEEAVRRRITSPELRSSFGAAENDKYELFVDLLLQQHSPPTREDAAAALDVSERARARVLLESLIDARADLSAGADPALLERERTLQRQLNEASARLTRLLVSKAADPQREAAARTVDDLSSQYDQLQATIRQKTPRYASITQPKALASSEIQQMLDEHTVLLEFMLGEKRSWLWAVTPGSIDVFELPPRHAIETAARSLYRQFTARQRKPGEDIGSYAQRVASADARLRPQSAAMSRMLFGPIARRLNGEWSGRRLAIVASGALEYLPFGALPVPAPRTAHADVPARATSAHPVALIAQREIVTVPSASVLDVLRRETADRPPAAKGIAIVADPVFDGGDPRVQPASAGRGRIAATLPARVEQRTGLARLPFSREEADAIAALVGSDRVFKATDFAASRSLARDGSLAGYRIVHFATHGVIDAARPALSGLVLSLVDEHGGSQDGYLRLHDIYNLRLDADLVVLSACQTALGKEIRGEGLVGLARAFMYAGAARVVASLWEVNDVATAELMKGFYRAMLGQHLRPAAALRRAKLELSRDPRWSSPYYWAGFVIEGDWK